MIHVVKSDRYSVGVDPENGGRVEWLKWRGSGAEYDLFRPRPERDADRGRIPLYGNFAMLPFCNRLLPMAMRTSAGPVEVEMNWPSERCAIHGLGCDTAWSAEDGGTAQSCRWTCRIATGAGVELGRGIQEISVSDDEGVVHRVGFRNESADWILAGVGFHPWFYMPGTDACLEFRAEGRFVADDALYPQRYERLQDTLCRLGPESDDGLDQCFAGWSGWATLRLPHLPAMVHLGSDAPHLHVYVNRELQAICAEPQTHVTNATHDTRWDGIAGMKRLARGETMWVEYRVEVFDPD